MIIICDFLVSWKIFVRETLNLTCESRLNVVNSNHNLFNWCGDQIWFEAFKHGIMLLILGSINSRFHNVVLEMSLCCYTIIFSSGPIFPFLVSIQPKNIGSK